MAIERELGSAAHYAGLAAFYQLSRALVRRTELFQANSPESDARENVGNLLAPTHEQVITATAARNAMLALLVAQQEVSVKLLVMPQGHAG